jgi:translation initiation factor IF-1
VTDRAAGRLVEGTVRERLARALYRVAIDGGGEITAHAPNGLGRNFVRLVVGDRVRVALTARDVTRGRIVEKTEGRG